MKINKSHKIDSININTKIIFIIVLEENNSLVSFIFYAL
jgi:hypothetical protein